MLTSTNRSVKAYATIKEFLLKSSIYVGHKISPLELGKKLGISQTPLRESLLRLAAEGLLAHQNYQGFFVPEITYKQAHEIYEARMAIEPALIDHVIDRITDEDTDFFEDLLEKYKNLVDQPYSRKRLWVDRQFHIRLAHISGNDTMTEILDRLFDQLIMKRRLEHLPLHRGQKAYIEHLSLLEAIKDKDRAKVRRSLLRHLSNGRDFVLGDLRIHQEQEENLKILPSKKAVGGIEA
jgi:DNA-binding GntR family transcriptional regulator